MYLDQNLLGQKVDRIKFLVDLLRDLIRLHQFHRNEDGSMVDRHKSNRRSNDR